MEPTGLVLVLAAVLSLTTAYGQGQEAVPIDSDDLGGVVTGPSGPEAGVWVIAETTDLPTKLVKIVVTDEEGRYLVPDLPQATYDVWVRGYGLVDSPKEQAMPGSGLNLTAVAAPDPHAAAQYFPAGYWFSLIQPPAKTEFPGTGPSGNGISPDIDNQAQWLRGLKTGSCLTCHQLGNKATREISPELGHFDSTAAAWERRIQAGQAGGNMLAGIGQIGPGPDRCGSRGLDGSDCRGRAPTDAASTPRAGAQRRHHRVGLGPTRRYTSTISRRRTGGPRPSTPMVQSLGRWRIAQTICPCSTRWRTRRAR